MVSVRETTLTRPEGVLVEPEGATTGVLVLSGSSGRIEVDRCRLLASHGVAAASIRYFGGEGQTAEACQVPLEVFDDVLADVHARYDRLAVLGSSWGAQAALLLGTLHAEVDAVVGISPTHLVWAGLSADRPQRTSWTVRGEPLAFVPFDHDGIAEAVEEAAGEPPSFCESYLSAVEKYADRVPAATIPVERIAGDVVLVAGEDDALWPSALMAELVRRRRAASGQETVIVSHEGAGHRVVLPGEIPVPPSAQRAWGGSEEADRELGVLALPEILAVL